MGTHCQKKLEENGGDYFDLMDGMFDFSTSMLNEEWQLFDVIRCIFSSPENFRTISIPPAKNSVCLFPSSPPLSVTPTEWFLQRLDCSKLRPEYRPDISSLLSLGGATLFLSLKQYYEHPEAVEKIRKNYHRSINILRYGALSERAGTP